MKTTEDELLKAFVLPLYLDWPAEDLWRLFKPFIYEDKTGNLRMRKLDREPDGEPIGWTKVVCNPDGKDYLPLTDGCSCDWTKGVCQHWREVRT